MTSYELIWRLIVLLLLRNNNDATIVNITANNNTPICTKLNGLIIIMTP